MRRRVFLNKSEDPIIPKENILRVSYNNLVVGEEYNYFTEKFDMSPIERITYWDGYEAEAEVSKTFIADDDYRSVTFYFKNSPTTLAYMFNGDENIYSVDFSELDTSKVTDMTEMYHSMCVEYSYFTDFDTRNVTTMEYAFYDSCFGEEIENFNTSKVTNMAWCFERSSIYNFDLKKWDVSNVTDMTGMFYFSDGVDYENIRTWNTSNVTSMADMFGMGSYDGDLNQFFHTFNFQNLTDMSGIFDCYGNWGDDIIIDGVYTPKLQNMNGAFTRLYYVANVSIKNWDTSTVTDMGWLFNDCEELETVYLDLDMSNLKRGGADYMFSYCDLLTEVTLMGKPSTNTGVYDNMFKGVETDGTLYYNKNYDYSKIISVLPSTWTAVAI